MTIGTYNFKLDSERTAPIHVLTHKGREVWTAQEIGAALGYSDPSKLTDNITGPWADRFRVEKDTIKVEGEDLDAIKRLATDSVASDPSQEPIIHPRTRSLLLLTESGVFLACALAKTEAGDRFRWWLADEVLPALHRAQRQIGAGSPPTSLEARRLVLGECKLMQRALVELARAGALSQAEYSRGLADVYARMAIHLGMRPLNLLPLLDEVQGELTA